MDNHSTTRSVKSSATFACAVLVGLAVLLLVAATLPASAAGWYAALVLVYLVATAVSRRAYVRRRRLGVGGDH